MNGKYDDIMGLSRPVSPNRAQMSNYDRAAQFSPFSALTGYEEAVTEAGRLTDPREETSDNRSAELNRVLCEILEHLEDVPLVRVTRFLPDSTKAGGSYETGCFRIRKVDLYRRELWTEAGGRLPMDDIWEMEML